MGALAVFLSGAEPPRAAALQDMFRASPHRGTEARTVVLGQAAIGILDGILDDAWIADGDRLAAVFTGTLDNRQQLSRMLLPEQDEPTPAAVIIAAYERHGEQFPGLLRGVFSGAVTDGRHVFCFRDHVGYAPIFYRNDNRGFYAATEAKQIVAGAAIPKEPDLDVVARILFRDLDDETPCALRGVSRLPKASGLVADAAGIRIQRFWNPEALLETAKLSRPEIGERFDYLMSQAVVRCFAPTNVLSLSGGIDSPAIAAYGADRHLELTGSPLHALTAIYPRYSSVDERRYVVPLAKRFGMPLRMYEHRANGLADIARWTALADTPYQASSLAQYAEHYGHARAWGFRSVLSGEHAEFVVGMQWYLLDHYLTHLRFGRAWHHLAERRQAGASWLSLTRLVARSIAPESLMKLRRAFEAKPSRFVPTWIDGRRRGDRPIGVRQRWRALQLTAFVGPGVSLEAEEVCQAVSGVRSRKPWTDIDLWEFFLRLPAEQKYPDRRSKGLVRDLLRGRVPDVILDRTDKTLFDEAALAEIDYATLWRYVGSPAYRIPGVDYTSLASRLQSRTLTTLDYQWAKNLAVAHAFLAQW